MTAKYLDSRRELRIPADGEILISFRNPQQRRVDGHLVDLSSSGFRVAHASRELLPGQVVEFRHPESVGSARVVWNRILEGNVETGFLILAEKRSGEVKVRNKAAE